MHKYRIGRVIGPWDNLTPPLHGGVHRALPKRDSKYLDVEAERYDSEEDSGTASDSGFSLASSNTSIDAGECESELLTHRAIKGGLKINQEDDRALDGPQDSVVVAAAQLSREAYIAQACQQEVDDSIRDNPSLDAATQRGIKLKYQALHKRIKAEGYYDCNYSEYAKEFARYSLLFSMFLGFLKIGWYIPSAICLGFFWVSDSYYDIRVIMY